MTKYQMEMLSAKSAIERAVQGYIATYSRMDASPDTVNQFFDTVEKLVAAMFVSGQINNNYLVRADNVGNLHIAMTVGQHNTQLTFLLPISLRWTVEKMIPKAETSEVSMTPELATQLGVSLIEDLQYFQNKPMSSVAPPYDAEKADFDATLAFNNAMKVVER